MVDLGRRPDVATSIRRVLAVAVAVGSVHAVATGTSRAVAETAQVDGEAEIQRYVVAYHDDELRGRGGPGSPPDDGGGWEVVEAAPDRVEELRADPSIASVEIDHTYRLARAPMPGAPAPVAPRDVVDTQHDPPWGLDRIDQRSRELSGTYTPTGSGRGVVVYVVDDGIDGRHPDFGGRVRPGMSAVAGGDPTACSRHGSHVAGVIGGTVSGVAKQVDLVPVRVFGCDQSSSLSTLLSGIDWVLRHHDPATPGVVNLSLEGPASPMLDARISMLVERGLVVVAAAGNTATDACGVSPARAAGAITVGATEISDGRAGFSNVGACVDLFAPGVAVRSVSLPNGLEFRNGTSMAAPHVAGAAALLLAAEPELTPAQVRARLQTDATTSTVLDAGPGSPDRLLRVEAAPVVPTSASMSPTAEIGGDGSSSMTPGPAFVGAEPERVLDTRSGGRVAAGSISMVPVVGRSGVPASVTDGSGAVVVNVTAVDPAVDGYLTVYPCGSTPPTTSNVNFRAGVTVANVVVTPVGSGGVCVATSADTHLLVDVAGSIVSGFVGRPPERVADTRSTAIVSAGSVLPVATGVPSSAGAAIATVTAVDPRADGYLTVFACDLDDHPHPDRPGSSNVNFTTGHTVANTVVSSVGPSGHLCVYASADTHVLVDVSGHSGVTAGWPERVLDTRASGAGRLVAGSVTEVGVPSTGVIASDAAAVVLNLTVVEPGDAGYLTVFPCGGSVPEVSNTNVRGGDTVATAVISAVDAGGDVCVFTSVDTHVLVDVVGTIR